MLNAKPLSIIFLSILLISLIGCSNENEEKAAQVDKEHSEQERNADPSASRFGDIVDYLDILEKRLVPETKRIDFKGEEAKNHILRGWHRAEKNSRWAKKRASLLFCSYSSSSDIELDILCRAFPSAGGKPQTMSVFLNDNAVDSVTISEKGFENVKIRLPGARLNSGINFLDLAFSYANQPATLYGNKDGRFLSVCFKSMDFSSNKNVRFEQGTELHQGANSRIDHILEISSGFRVIGECAIPAGASAALEILGQNGALVALELTEANPKFDRIVPAAKEGLIKIRLASRGNSHQSVIWKKINIGLPGKQQEVAYSPGSEGFSKIRKPDIMFYIVDALRQGHVSCYGYERKTTPKADEFSNDGALFRNAYTSTTWTKPSGASLLTGLLPNRHGAVDRNDKLVEELKTMPEILRENGYYTVAFSTNGNISETFGFTQGFDEFISLGKDPVTLSSYSDQLNVKIIEFIEEYVRQPERKPLFLFIWTVDPHSPYTPRESVKELFDIDQFDPIDTYDFGLLAKIHRGEIKVSDSQKKYIVTRYDQEVFFNDISFGAVLDSFRKNGLYEDAFIVFTADHGEEFFDHNGMGHGATLYNELIRIPLIIKSDRLENKDYRAPVQLLDILPTLLDLLGIAEPYKLDGTSLFAEHGDDRTLYFDTVKSGHIKKAAIYRDKKLILNMAFSRTDHFADLGVFESYALEDATDEHPLPISGLEDEYRKQLVFAYIFQKNASGIKQYESSEAEISQELDQHLKDLGYVK